MNNTFYFSHDGNARGDQKILYLRASHGWEGYGIYWMLIEMMFECSESKLEHENIPAIAYDNQVKPETLQSIVDTCIKKGLFISDGNYFWSNSLRCRKELALESRNKKSVAGKIGMEKRWGSSELPKDNNSVITVLETSNNTPITPAVTNDNNKKKLNEIKGKEIKSNEIKSSASEYTLFDKFYAHYPRKTKRPDAERAFNKLLMTEELFDKIMTSIDGFKKSRDWKKDNGQFIPYPATWLNARQWEDEIPNPDIAGKKEVTTEYSDPNSWMEERK